MTTLANGTPLNSRPGATTRGARLFYLIMALAITATVVFGFTLNASRARFAFADLPPLVHLHAGLCMLWIALFVAQSGLIVAGSVGRHRILGWAGAVLAIALVVTGVAVTVACLQRGAVPPFFPPSLFLVMDVLGVLAFFVLTASAVALRRRSGWHRRLMVCGTVVLMAPAVARILPMPALGPLGGWLVTGVLIAFVLAGVGHDLLTRRRAHAAWFVGLLTILFVQVMTPLIAFSGPVIKLTANLLGVRG